MVKVCFGTCLRPAVTAEFSPLRDFRLPLLMECLCQSFFLRLPVRELLSWLSWRTSPLKLMVEVMVGTASHSCITISSCVCMHMRPERQNE